jgi:phenylpropionate dioxygenase-like ring-hydroxylating dioxygenase large terminal subunit
MSLPGWLYHDAEFLEAEKGAFLRAAPQVVCHSSEIAAPGDWRSLEYLGESVIVIRGDDGVARAFANVCRHRGSRLVDGEAGCAKVLTCPYHAWSYARDGRLVGVPHRAEYPGLEAETLGLVPVALEEWRGFLFVRLQPTPVRPELVEGLSSSFGAGQEVGQSFDKHRTHGIQSSTFPTDPEMMAPYEAEVEP